VLLARNTLETKNAPKTAYKSTKIEKEFRIFLLKVGSEFKVGLLETLENKDTAWFGYY
jgi:hypothetical protein